MEAAERCRAQRSKFLKTKSGVIQLQRSWREAQQHELSLLPSSLLDSDDEGEVPLAAPGSLAGAGARTGGAQRKEGYSSSSEEASFGDDEAATDSEATGSGSAGSARAQRVAPPEIAAVTPLQPAAAAVEVLKAAERRCSSSADASADESVAKTAPIAHKRAAKAVSLLMGAWPALEPGHKLAAVKLAFCPVSQPKACDAAPVPRISVSVKELSQAIEARLRKGH
jgi:hypothetical protein